MSGGSIPIYFVQRPFHRARQRDTVARLPEPFRAIVPAGMADGVPDHEANLRRSRSLRGRLAGAAVRTPAPINVTALRDPRVRECELVYTWGKLPLWPPTPRFVVELDNPYVLTLYYNLQAHRRMRPLLRRVLLSDRCAGIVTIAESSRITTARTLGSDVADKARVVHPYVPRLTQAAPGERAGLELLFIGTQFWLKGGRELCAAFNRVARDVPNIRLTMVTRVPDEIRRAYAGAPIRFIEANLSRERSRGLLGEADLFVMPTLMESYGMAVLEAVAAGLPVLTSRIYALPEIVADGESGLLLDDHLGMWRNLEANPELWGRRDLDEYVRGQEFPAHEQAIEAALRALVTDRSRIRAMAAASRARFESRFAPERRAADFGDALRAFIAHRGPS